MAAISNRVSSLFDFTEKRLGVTGSSITSFACDPKHDDEPGRPGKKVYYENTYRLEPPAKFRADKVKPIIESVLQKNLEGKKYDPIECSLLAKALSDDLKVKVKELNFKRYKILALVTIGQKNDQGVQVGSRFLWDPERDNYAVSTFHNKSIFAVGAVYAVYYE